jgi:phospholipid transport system substrate-binding protein
MTIVKTRRRLIEALTVLGLAAALGATSLPQPSLAATGAAEAFVQGFADRVLATLRDRSLPAPQRLRAVDGLVEQGFALDRVARLALGRYWRSASASERREFSELFKAAVLASYSRRFDDYADRRLRVASAAPAGEQVSVETYLEGGTAPIRLDWRVAELDGSWRVLDIVVEGVSLLVTYRNEFAAVIEQHGGQVAALIVELRTRAGARAGRATG